MVWWTATLRTTISSQIWTFRLLGSWIRDEPGDYPPRRPRDDAVRLTASEVEIITRLLKEFLADREYVGEAFRPSKGYVIPLIT